MVYKLLYTIIGIYCRVKWYIMLIMMRKITLSIPDDLDKGLRQRTEIDYSGIKGGLSIIVIQSIREWFKNHPTEQN
jgi:hypothetical protein